MNVDELRRKRELAALIGAAKSATEAKHTAKDEHSREPIGTWNHSGVNGVERGVKAPGYGIPDLTGRSRMPQRDPQLTGRDKIIRLDRSLLVKVVKGAQHDALRAGRLATVEQLATVHAAGDIPSSIMARLKAMAGQAASE